MTYEKSVSEATARKEILESSLTSLEWACTSAQNAAATGKAENQNTYDSAVLEGEYADTVYDSTVASYQEALEEAENALKEAKEQQSALLALNNGIITAEYAGASATSGRSMSNVTYTVKVSIDNSEGTLAADTSAYVIFNYGTLEDVDYILSEAISNAANSQGKVKKYNEAGEIEEITVTLGESTDQYTSVKERTNEIGILKAIGCSKKNILLECFLCNIGICSWYGDNFWILSSISCI